MEPSATDIPLSFDVSQVGREKTRQSLRASFETHGGSHVEKTDFWKSFFDESPGAHARTLVIADLARIAGKYRAHDYHRWIASVRRDLPYFVALVRTKRDREYADLVDDIVKHSDFRISVCKISGQKDIDRCVSDALSALHPNTVMDVRYFRDSDHLWVLFGDGSSGSVSWKQLGIDDLRSTLVPESATVGEHGTAVEILTTDGDLFDIDAGSIKAILDTPHADAIAEKAHQSDVVVGERVRAARKQANMSQKDLERGTGIDQAIISKLERGKHQPRVDTLKRIAEGLDLTLQDLLVGHDVPK